MVDSEGAPTLQQRRLSWAGRQRKNYQLATSSWRHLGGSVDSMKPSALLRRVATYLPAGDCDV
jgi:hypothetical protein